MPAPSPRPRARWPRLRRAARVCGLALLVLVGGLELWMRLSDGRPPLAARHAHPGVREIEGVELGAANVRGLFKGALHRTDAFGFRGRGRPLLRRQNAVRILVVGDSVTMGAGVEDEESYAGRLPALLARHPELPPVDIVNAGLGGADLDLALHRLRRAMNAYGGDILVYGFTANDIEGDAWQEPPEDESASEGLLWKLLARSPLQALRIAPPARRWLLDQWDPEGRDRGHRMFWNYFRNPAAWAELERGLDRLAAYAEAREGCGVVLIHTTLTDLGLFHRFGPIYDQVEAAARRRGLGVASSYEEHRWRRTRPLWRNAYDPHPNAKGHALLAASLERALLRLPERCWDPTRPQIRPPVP